MLSGGPRGRRRSTGGFLCGPSGQRPAGRADFRQLKLEQQPQRLTWARWGSGFFHFSDPRRRAQAANKTSPGFGSPPKARRELSARLFASHRKYGHFSSLRRQVIPRRGAGGPACLSFCLSVRLSGRRVGKGLDQAARSGRARGANIIGQISKIRDLAGGEGHMQIARSAHRYWPGGWIRRRPQGCRWCN